MRKTAHITEFAVLHLTVLFALFQWELPWKKWLKAALAVTVAYACTDELHQLFVPGRAGMVTDVLIDSTGAALITGLLWIVGRRREGTSGEDGTVWAAGRPEDRSRRFPGPDSPRKADGPGSGHRRGLCGPDHGLPPHQLRAGPVPHL